MRVLKSVRLTYANWLIKSLSQSLFHNVFIWNVFYSGTMLNTKINFFKFQNIESIELLQSIGIAFTVLAHPLVCFFWIVLFVDRTIFRQPFCYIYHSISLTYVPGDRRLSARQISGDADDVVRSSSQLRGGIPVSTSTRKVSRDILNDGRSPSRHHRVSAKPWYTWPHWLENVINSVYICFHWAA